MNTKYLYMLQGICVIREFRELPEHVIFLFIYFYLFIYYSDIHSTFTK